MGNALQRRVGLVIVANYDAPPYPGIRRIVTGVSGMHDRAGPVRAPQGPHGSIALGGRAAEDAGVASVLK
jgi:hypothetical protein